MDKISKDAYPHNTLRFDWLVIVVITWLWIGVFLDAWAHNHLKIMETFFSWWHAVLYTGFLAVVIVLVANALIHIKKGYTLFHAVPKGYNTTFIGFVVFAIGGILDLVWHALFGFELSIDALLSPTHMLLAASGVFIICGVIRSGLQQKKPHPTLFSQLPLIIAGAYLISLLNHLTQYSNPMVLPFAQKTVIDTALFFKSIIVQQALGVSGLIIHTAFFMGLLLFLVVRKRLLPGSITIIFTINAILLTIMREHYQYIASAFLAGIVCDILLYFLRPDSQKIYRFYIFAFLVPIIYYIGFLVNIMLTATIWWSVHAVAGAVASCGLTGLLLAVLITSCREE